MSDHLTEESFGTLRLSAVLEKYLEQIWNSSGGGIVHAFGFWLANDKPRSGLGYFGRSVCKNSGAWLPLFLPA